MMVVPRGYRAARRSVTVARTVLSWSVGVASDRQLPYSGGQQEKKQGDTRRARFPPPNIVHLGSFDVAIYLDFMSDADRTAAGIHKQAVYYDSPLRQCPHRSITEPIRRLCILSMRWICNGYGGETFLTPPPLLCLKAKERGRGEVPCLSVPQFIPAVWAELRRATVRYRCQAKTAIRAEFWPGCRRASAY